jgi:uncharacterized membrane protein
VFLTSGFDLGIFNQAFHTTLFDGKLFYETGDLSFNPGGSFFGVHFSPILFLLLPFYAIYPSVEILLVMQTVILALGAFPIYWMSRDKLGKKVGLMVSIVYFVYPPLFLLNLNDFHLEAFTSTFFLFSVYYFEQEEWMKFSALMILTMLTVEFAPIIGVSMALYGLLLYSKNKFKDRKTARKYIALTVLVSAVIFVLALKTKEYFNTYTSPLPSPFHFMLSDPARILNVIFNDWDKKMFYLINFLGPLAFLPLLALEPLIMAFPWIFAGFSSTYQFYYSVYFQYTGFVIPFVFVALPKAIERLNNLQNSRKIFSVILLCTTIFAVYLPVGQGSPWNYQLPIINERVELMREILPLIPPNASILTQSDIFPHVSNRAEAYMYIPTSTNVSVDYVLIDVASEFYAWQQPAIFGDRDPPIEYTIEVLKNRTFGILASAKSIVLLKRGYAGEPAMFVPYVASFNYKNLILDSGSVIEDPTSTSGRVLVHSATHTKGMLWHGPWIELPFGLYKATFVVKVDNASGARESDHLLTVEATASSGEDLLANKYVYGINAPHSGDWFNVTRIFGLTMPAEDVEFRGYAYWGDNVYLDYLVVEQLSPYPVSYTELMFNSEDLLINKETCTVSDGAIVHSRGSGTCWYGPIPYASLPKGNYTAKFWLKLDQPYNGTLIDIGVTINLGKKVLASLTVSGSNFTDENTWQSFEIKFTLQNDSNTVEFPGLYVREFAPVSFLFVEVYTNTEGLL